MQSGKHVGQNKFQFVIMVNFVKLDLLTSTTQGPIHDCFSTSH